MTTPYNYPRAVAATRLPANEKHTPAPLLTDARREILFARAEPTEALPRGLAPASLAGQLRLLELQLASLTREIDGLRTQLAAVAAGPQQ
ncbi:MAG TPA: hypothetical protein VFO93_11605 [Hymenobacter sp.]|uniref:hypothetical protein n=1 Tax=Hymenobacter sp. TaxID=1898978 RepID=UPI002D80DBFA|nr:hypothetical protein [Hymenobacter sp.]HET9504179.1 hypothetical protein [Hymenobacter sp.]